jgi:Uma2 family endonuclease
MSTAVAAKTRHTPEDLLAMPADKSYELVRGQLVERNRGVESSWVAGQLLIRLGRFCGEHEIGWLLAADAGYQCFPHDPGMVRKPGASIVRRGRSPGDVLPKGWSAMAPDLAIEVVSPNDRVSDLEEKLGNYRSAGVPLVWVIYPDSRTVWSTADGLVSRLLEDDELSGEDVVPGFRCRIREILPPRPNREQTHPTAAGPNQPQ